MLQQHRVAPRLNKLRQLRIARLILTGLDPFPMAVGRVPRRSDEERWRLTVLNVHTAQVGIWLEVVRVVYARPAVLDFLTFHQRLEEVELIVAVATEADDGELSDGHSGGIYMNRGQEEVSVCLCDLNALQRKSFVRVEVM